MLSGRWSKDNRAALEELLSRNFAFTPIAIFDWDNTCARGDIADLTFHHLCADLKFDFENAGFWAWIDESAVPNRVDECYQDYARAPNDATRQRLRFELERMRYTLHEGADDNWAWAWDTGAFVGWTPDAVGEYTRRMIRQELASAFAIEELRLEDQRLEIAHGLREFPEMRELMHTFRAVGWEVRVISASPQWEVEAFAERYGLDASQIVAMRREVVDGKITARIDSPVSWGDGKLDAYQLFVSRERPPTFVAGDSLGDWKLLEWATECALLIEPTQDALRNYARWRRELGECWLIQPFEETR